MVIEKFLKLKKEKFDNNVKVIMNKIVKAYSISDKSHETNKKYIIIPIFGYTETIQALYKLCFYKEQNNNKSSESISCIN